jgi:hypothetical protein
MDSAWESEFQERMRSFDAVQPGDGLSVPSGQNYVSSDGQGLGQPSSDPD